MPLIFLGVFPLSTKYGALGGIAKDPGNLDSLTIGKKTRVQLGIALPQSESGSWEVGGQSLQFICKAQQKHISFGFFAHGCIEIPKSNLGKLKQGLATEA